MDIGAVAVIFNRKNEVLITQRQDLRNWVFPGGGVKKGESIEQAVIREVKEETGAKIKIERLVATYVVDHLLKRTVLYIFKASYIKGGIKRQKGEVLSIRWATQSQAKELMGKRQLWRLKAALSFRQGIKLEVEKKLPISYWRIPIYWWRRGLGKKLRMVRV